MGNLKNCPFQHFLNMITTFYGITISILTLLNVLTIPNNTTLKVNADDTTTTTQQIQNQTETAELSPTISVKNLNNITYYEQNAEKLGSTYEIISKSYTYASYNYDNMDGYYKIHNFSKQYLYLEVKTLKNNETINLKITEGVELSNSAFHLYKTSSTSIVKCKELNETQANELKNATFSELWNEIINVDMTSAATLTEVATNSTAYRDYNLTITSQNLTTKYYWIEQNISYIDTSSNIWNFTYETQPSLIKYTINTTYTQIIPNQEVIPIAEVMLTILGMPFNFISTAFNLTLFENTPYAINIGAFIKGLIAILTILFIIKLFAKGIEVFGTESNKDNSKKE